MRKKLLDDLWYAIVAISFIGMIVNIIYQLYLIWR